MEITASVHARVRARTQCRALRVSMCTQVCRRTAAPYHVVRLTDREVLVPRHEVALWLGRVELHCRRRWRVHPAEIDRECPIDKYL